MFIAFKRHLLFGGSRAVSSRAAGCGVICRNEVCRGEICAHAAVGSRIALDWLLGK